MALIFKNANEQTPPTWWNKTASLDLPLPSDAISEEEVRRVASLPLDLDDKALGKELDIIEARGNTKEVYHYSSSWNEEVKNTIKEYCLVSNCTAVEIDPKDENLLAFASLTKKEMVKTASTMVKEPTETLKDSFLIDTPFIEKNDKSVQEGLKGLAKARSGIPSVEAKGVTISRASSSIDDDNAGIGMRSTSGRNVIQDPNSIGRSVNSHDEDVGVRLRRERSELVEARKVAKKAQQRELVKEMNKAGYGATDSGNFRLTEAASVQGGISRKLNQELPEFTKGEEIVAKRKEKESFQASKKAEAKKQWNYLKGSAKPNISDSLASALKTELGKIQ